MADLPIPFSAPMSAALVAGRKTQTRRVITKQAALDAITVFGPDFLLKPGNRDLLKYAVGDHLWVREAWRTWRDDDEMTPLDIVEFMDPGRRRAGMHLPRRLSRTTLVVTDVRVQQLQKISEADAIAEGFMALTKDGKTVKYGIPDRDGLPGSDDHGWPWPEWNADPRKAYATLWDRINGRGAWKANPWVAAQTFSAHRCNIDQMEAAHA